MSEKFDVGLNDAAEKSKKNGVKSTTSSPVITDAKSPLNKNVLLTMESYQMLFDKNEPPFKHHLEQVIMMPSYSKRQQ
ncbi:hypothetical protein Phum_PHUM435920 [Pediculus humanus corporis]|uniref:Uncharacterized protein n=1 Tax=Pediculus humanus subsp. corporis TaxID=121224 RepID=E0VTQ7_PEDHC|nr:uncharacterized protein Phum_PHUM435920 [Pediculus humanus corporis]EEB16763.1 hypothetical protein Phum_PHUM435920 [Pediculus humanus corporis]